MVAVLGASAAFAGPQEGKEKAKPAATIGEAAPAFELQNAEGKAFKLSDYKGKIVVLQWINPDCPVCVRVTKSGLVTQMREELKKIDPEIVHLAINSTHYQEADAGAKYYKEYKIDVPVLVDQDGTVGRLYGARTTPHIFVIDAEGILRYNGAIDNDRSGGKGKNATNYVVNAVSQITAGETVAPDKSQPYGCSVKYKGGQGKGRRGR
jgi:peroxiredoxin